MGTEKIITDTTSLCIDFKRDGNKKGIAAAILIPSILAKIQIKNDLIR
jgi:hypothetical protein